MLVISIKLNELVTSCLGTAFYNTVLREDKKNDGGEGKTRTETLAATE